MGKPASPSNDTEFPVEFERAIYQLSSFHPDLSNLIPTWVGVVNRIVCVNSGFAAESVQAIALIELALINYYLRFFLICENYTCSDPRLFKEVGDLVIQE